MEEGRRTLAAVLFAGGLFWIAAEVVKETQGPLSDTGHGLATVAFALIAIGIWAGFAARPGLPRALGSGLAFLGMVWFAYVAVRSIGAAGELQDQLTGSTLYFLAGIAAAAGAVILGGAIILGGTIERWLGTALIATTVVAALTVVIDVSSLVNHAANSAVAIVLVAMGSVWLVRTRSKVRYYRPGPYTPP